MPRSLRTVTDRFSLVDLHRKHTAQNGRNYMLDAVGRTLNSPETQERIKLGEAYGYYGHGRREMTYKNTGSIKLQETSVIMVEGQPIVIDNVPSNRTLDISLSPDGIVTHVQELLDTPTGSIVDGMERSLAGGWSWATKGGTQGGQSIIREYAGMDYVMNPNFISLDRVVMMNESAEDEEAAVVRSLMTTNGMTEAAAQTIYHHFKKMHEGMALFESAQRATDLELELFAVQGQYLAERDARLKQTAMFEAAGAAKAARKVAVENMLTNLPYHVTDVQKAALINQDTPEDMAIFTALFESVARSTVNNLPVGRPEPAPVSVHKDRHDDPGSLEIVARAGSTMLQNRFKR